MCTGEWPGDWESESGDVVMVVVVGKYRVGRAYEGMTSATYWSGHPSVLNLAAALLAITSRLGEVPF